MIQMVILELLEVKLEYKIRPPPKYLYLSREEILDRVVYQEQPLQVEVVIPIELITELAVQQVQTLQVLDQLIIFLEVDLEVEVVVDLIHLILNVPEVQEEGHIIGGVVVKACLELPAVVQVVSVLTIVN